MKVEARHALALVPSRCGAAIWLVVAGLRLACVDGLGEITYRCDVCGTVYDPLKHGHGMEFEELPNDWKCPVCGWSKSAYKALANPLENILSTTLTTTEAGDISEVNNSQQVLGGDVLGGYGGCKDEGARQSGWQTIGKPYNTSSCAKACSAYKYFTIAARDSNCKCNDDCTAANGRDAAYRVVNVSAPKSGVLEMRWGEMLFGFGGCKDTGPRQSGWLSVNKPYTASSCAEACANDATGVQLSRPYRYFTIASRDGNCKCNDDCTPANGRGEAYRMMAATVPALKSITHVKEQWHTTHLPFDSSKYSQGPIVVASTSPQDHSSAVAYLHISGDQLYVGLAASTAGYIALGLNDKSVGMDGSDIVVCREGSDGNIAAFDFHATRNGMPLPDVGQDWTTHFSGRIFGQDDMPTVTFCEVSRPLAGCDISHDINVGCDKLADEINLLIAWSPPGVASDILIYHGAHHRRSLPFAFQPVVEEPLPPADYYRMTIQIPDHKVSNMEGSYAYSMHKLPLPDERLYHITEWRYINNPNSPAHKAGLQHHMNVHECAPGTGDVTPGFSSLMGNCDKVIMTGSGRLPEDQGFAIGGDGVRVVAISRHYYNVGKFSGVMDTNRAVEITYTSRLRPKTIQQISMWINPGWLRVPAFAKEHTVRAMCPPVCTERVGKVSVLSVFFHMHANGRRAMLRVVRGGEEIEPLAVVDHWGPSKALVMVRGRELLPGDRYMLDCVYDNLRDSVLTGGAAVQDEMCTALLTVVGQTDDPVAACVQVGPGHHRCKTWKLPGHTTIDPEFTANASTYEGGEYFQPLGHAGRMVPVPAHEWIGKYRDSNFKPFNKTEQLLKNQQVAITCNSRLQKEREATPPLMRRNWSFVNKTGCTISQWNYWNLSSNDLGSSSSSGNEPGSRGLPNVDHAWSMRDCLAAPFVLVVFAFGWS